MEKLHKVRNVRWDKQESGSGGKGEIRTAIVSCNATSYLSSWGPMYKFERYKSNPYRHRICTLVGWVCTFWSSLCVWPVSWVCAVQVRAIALNWTCWKFLRHGLTFELEEYYARPCPSVENIQIRLSIGEILCRRKVCTRMKSPSLSLWNRARTDVYPLPNVWYRCSRCKQDWRATNFFPWTMSSHVRITICQCQKRRTISELEASYLCPSACSM